MKNQDIASLGAQESLIRWRFPFVLLLTVFVAYLDRMKISYALPKIAEDYGWSVQQTGNYGGLLMSVFYIGYGLSNIFLSPIGEKYGPRKSLLFIIICFSLICMLQAPLALMFIPLLTTRLFLGIAEGIHFPMMNVLTKNWFPPFERSRANAIWLAGIQGSMIFAPLIVIPIIEFWNWRIMFIVLGLTGLIVVLPSVWFTIVDTPKEHRKIGAKELAYIENNLEKDLPEKEHFWEGVRYFLKNRNYWICVLAGILSNVAAFGTLSWLPTYFTEARGLKFSDMAYATSIPFVFAIIGLLFWAYLGDKSNRRNLLAAIGALGAGISIYFATRDISVVGTVAFFSLAVFFQSSYSAGGFVVVQRILPQTRVASGIGLFNGLSMLIGGALGPIIVGGVVSKTGDFTMGILSLMFVSFATSAVLFILSRFLKY